MSRALAAGNAFSTATKVLGKVMSPATAHYLLVVAILVRRDLKVKYRGSLLGYAWSMLNPLLFMLILTMVFSHLVRGIEHYHLYVLSSMLLWTMGNTAISMGTQSISSNALILRKIKMPVWVFPCVPLGSSFQNLILALFPYLVIHIGTGLSFKAELIAAPLVLFAFCIFVCGISLTLSSLNVFFRDVGHVMEPVMALLFYATPVFYSRTQPEFSERIQNLLALNPFTHFLEAWRACWLPAYSLNYSQLLICIACSALSATIGASVYKISKSKIIFKL